MSPARVVSVDILADDEYSKEALVIVPDDQLSLAIGRGGQNVRLAHKLTGWKIDIKSVSQAEAMDNSRGYEEEDQYEEPVEEDMDDEIQEEEINQEEYGVDEEDVAELNNGGEEETTEE